MSDLVCGVIKPLPWENDFFGVHSGLLELQGETPIAPEEMARYALLQAKVPAGQHQQLDALNALGFQLVEGEADCVLGVTPVERPAGIRIARAEHIPALRQAAGEAFAFSRFRQPWYAPGDSGRFYAQWIENAVLGTFDHQCLLAIGEQGEMQGFISLRELADGAARIGLLAVLPDAQGLGVGQRLMTAAIDWCRVRRLSRLHVATQLGNLAALRLYLRCGGVVERTAYWLYRKTP